MTYVKFFALLSTFTLISCATTEIERIAANKYQVKVYSGSNGIKTQNDMKNFALYNGAGLAQTTGYKFITISKEHFSGTNHALVRDSLTSQMVFFKEQPNSSRAVNVQEFLDNYVGARD